MLKGDGGWDGYISHVHMQATHMQNGTLEGGGNALGMILFGFVYCAVGMVFFF